LFRIKTASPFCICWFNFSVVVIKQLLKALASCLDPLFLCHSQVSWECLDPLFLRHSQVRWETFPMNVVFLFLYNVPCCFYFVIRFCCKSIVVLSLAAFISFLRILQYLIRFSSTFGSLLFLLKAHRLLLCFQDIFIPCVVQLFSFFLHF